MATDKKTSALTAGTAFGLTDEMAIVQGGASVRVGVPAELLLAARTYYVRTNGSDSNNGLANTAGGAFLTIQHAINVAARADNRLYSCTIQIADGTYAEDLSVIIPGKDAVNGFSLYLLGNTATPANVVVQGLVGWDSDLDVRGITFTSAFSVYHGYCFLKQCRFSSAVIDAASDAVIDVDASVTVLGSIAAAFHLNNHSTIDLIAAVTVSGTPSYSTGFVHIQGFSQCFVAVLPTGAATGPRYALETRGLLNAGGASASLPGNASGTNTDTTGAVI